MLHLFSNEYFLFSSYSAVGSTYAFPNLILRFSASSSSICKLQISLVMLLPPKGMTAKWRRMLFLYTDTVVVSAPISTSTHPERFSFGVSMASAKAKGAIRSSESSAIPIVACSKHCLMFCFTLLRAMMFKKRASI